MGYATDHAGAVADIRDAGAPVTFSRTTPGTYNATTDTYTAPKTTTVVGHAVGTRGDPVRYQALSLVELAAPTLLFAPTTYGELPALGSTVTWAGIVHTVRDIQPIAPDGTAIIARIIVER